MDADLAAFQGSAQQLVAVHMGLPCGPGPLQGRGKASLAGLLHLGMLLLAQHHILLPASKCPAEVCQLASKSDDSLAGQLA